MREIESTAIRVFPMAICASGSVFLPRVLSVNVWYVCSPFHRHTRLSFGNYSDKRTY
jgi:hypothetical protein